MPYTGEYFGQYAGSYRGPLSGAPGNVFGGKVSGDVSEWEMFVSGTMTYSGPANERKLSVVAETYQADHPVDLGTGIKITGSLDELANPDRHYRLQIPLLGIDETHDEAGFGPLHTSVHLVGMKVYASSAARFRLVVDQIVWKTNGVSRGTFGPFDNIQVPYPLCPASVPLIGIPPRVSGGAAGSRIGPDSCITPSENVDEWTTDGEFSAGWRTKRGGDWVADAVLTTGANRLSATNTYNATWTTRGVEHNSGIDGRHHESEVGEYYLWPATTFDFERMNTDYEALVFRHGTYQYARRVASTETVVPCSGDDPTTTTTQSDTVVLPDQTQFLEAVKNPLGVCEGMNSIITPIPFSESDVEKDFPVSSGSGTINSTSRWFGNLYSGGGDLAPAYDHPAWQIHLWNSWYNRHWLFALYFPLDSGAVSTRWKLDGTESPTLYWQDQVRQQHIRHGALPGVQNSKHRVNVVTEGITQNGFAGLWNAVHLSPTPWGITRFSTLDRASWPSEFTTSASSAARFHFRDGAGDGAGSVGATIAMTTGDAIEFSLGSFTIFPYMTTTISDRVKVSWTDTNISAVRIYMLGREGTKVLISTSPAVSGTTYRVRQGDSGKWATSRADDRGGIYTTDGYTPDAAKVASDVSAATVSDAERSALFQLLPGWAGYRLRIEIDRVNAANPVAIDHPTFYQPSWPDAQIYHETSRCATILFKQGPALRFGSLSYFDYGLKTFLPVPDVASPDLAPTMGDLWAFENHFFKGEPAITGLVARLGAEFDTGEEHNGIIKHLWLDSFDQVTMFGGWVRSETGPVAFYYHGYRATVPDLTLFPERARRSAHGWKSVPSGADADPYVRKAYSHIGNKMPMVHPAPLGVRYLSPSGSTDLLTAEVAPLGWKVKNLVIATEGDEVDYRTAWDKDADGTWEIWYKSRPFSGSFNVLGLSEPLGGNCAYDVDYAFSNHAWALCVPGSPVEIRLAGNDLTEVVKPTTINAEWVDVALDRSSPKQVILLASEESGSVKLYKSVDLAANFALVDTVASTGSKPVVIVCRDGSRHIYWIDGSDLKGQIRGADEAVVKATFTAKSGVDDVGFDADESVKNGEKRIVLTVVEAGSLNLYTSPDGVTFT